MNHRERVLNVFNQKPTDRPAVEYMYSAVGFYEHGDKLNDLFEKYEGDFEPFTRREIPAPPATAFDADGRYFEIKTDDWGVTSEYRVYGIMGHAVDFPVKTLDHAKNYTFPPLPRHIQNPGEYKQSVAQTKKDRVAIGHGGGLLERMWALRGFENLMMDLYDETDEINGLMDRMAEYNRAHVEAAVDAGVDAVFFGDDYGSQNGLLISKETFRRAVKPRLSRMMEPARKKGVHIHFHSCGMVMDLFDEFKDLGVNSLWPQLPLYDPYELKRALDYYNFTLAIHTDRAGIMTSGTPRDVKETVLLENEIFKPRDGKSWFYIEPDTGFPFENIAALTETVFGL